MKHGTKTQKQASAKKVRVVRSMVAAIVDCKKMCVPLSGHIRRTFLGSIVCCAQRGYGRTGQRNEHSRSKITYRSDHIDLSSGLCAATANPHRPPKNRRRAAGLVEHIVAFESLRFNPKWLPANASRVPGPAASVSWI